LRICHLDFANLSLDLTKERFIAERENLSNSSCKRIAVLIEKLTALFSNISFKIAKYHLSFTQIFLMYHKVLVI